MGFIMIMLLLALFVGVPFLIFRTARKAFRLRNLQIEDLQARRQERRNPVAAPASATAAGWYPDPSGRAGQMYWDGQSWNAPQ
jgi:hypothetical protein